MVGKALPVLSIIGGDRDACAWWRVVSPANLLQRAGYPAYYAWQEEEGLEELAERARVVVYPRQSWGGSGAADMVAHAHANGRLVFGEYDDDVFVSRHEQKSHEELGKGHLRQATPEESIATVRALDGVTVSSPRLATVLESVAPDTPVRVVPNLVDLDYWRRVVPDRAAVRHPEARGHVTVGWFGGDRYDADILPLAQAWAEVAKRTRAHFVIMGHQPAPLVESVPRDRLHQIAWMPLEADADTPAYPVGVSQMDIVCANVAPTRFNAAKTPIKWMEGTVAGAAVVASSWLYGSAIDDGRTGLIADTAEEWARAIIRLVDAKHRRLALQRAAMRQVEARHALQSPGGAGVARWPRAWSELASAAVVRIQRGVA